MVDHHDGRPWIHGCSVGTRSEHVRLGHVRKIDDDGNENEFRAWIEFRKTLITRTLISHRLNYAYRTAPIMCTEGDPNTGTNSHRRDALIYEEAKSG